MVLGFTDTECRIAEFRYRELHADAERQRQATYVNSSSVPAHLVGVMAAMHRHIGALIEQVSHLLLSMRTQEATDHAAAPGTLAVSE